MTRFVIIENEAHYKALATGVKNFLITGNGIKIVPGDTVIIQHIEEEEKLICTAVETEKESEGLKKNYQVISLAAKAKEEQNA